MNVTLHTDKCISCGTCAALCPTVFSIDSGVVTLLKNPSTFTEEEKTQVKQAASMCPSGVIEVTE